MEHTLTPAPTQTPSADPVTRSAPYGIASLLVAIVLLVAEAAGVAVVGLLAHAHVAAGIIILSATPVAAGGLALAVISLCRREQRAFAHYGLWLNGWIAILSTPLAMAWMLAMR